MTFPFVIEHLTSQHNRRAFACGVEPLDAYFHQRVTQDMRRRLTACFVAIDADTSCIAGFYTLAAASLPLTELPASIAKKLPRYPLLPAVRLGRLAVDQRYRGQGLGGAMLFNALHRAVVSDIPAFAMLVDAKDDAAITFYQHHGFTRFASELNTLFLPLSEVAQHLQNST